MLVVVVGPRFQTATLLSVFRQCDGSSGFIQEAAGSHLHFNAEKVSQFPQRSRRRTAPKTPSQGWSPD